MGGVGGGVGQGLLAPREGGGMGGWVWCMDE